MWFNVGVQAKPQCSACFINSVQDNMGSIMDLAKTEGMLFKCPGTGTNGVCGAAMRRFPAGIASGPVSHEGLRCVCRGDQERRERRRAAKMVILNVEHPDIVEFIESKRKEERKAHVLIEQGDGADRRRGLHVGGLRTPTIRCA